MILITIINGTKAETTILASAPRTIVLDGRRFWMIPTEPEQPAPAPEPEPVPTKLEPPKPRPRRDKSSGASTTFTNFKNAIAESMIELGRAGITLDALRELGRQFYPYGRAPIGPALEQLKRENLAERTAGPGSQWRAVE